MFRCERLNIGPLSWSRKIHFKRQDPHKHFQEKERVKCSKKYKPTNCLFCGQVSFSTSRGIEFFRQLNELQRFMRQFLFLQIQQPWNAIAGLPEPGQMRSFTLNYGSGSRRPLNSSVASCFCVTSNRCDCGHPRFSRFCKGASSSRVRFWQTRR